MTTLAPAAAEMLDLACDGQPRPAIDFVLGLLADGMEIDDIITDVLAPVQREVGERWEANLLGVAGEHAATAVVDGALGALSLHTPVPGTHRAKVLVACAEGEYHTLAARMGSELLRADGWEVIFLGGSIPADDLQRYAELTEPDVVVISCTLPLFLAGARRCFAAVAAVGLPAIAAGAAFGPDDVRARRLGASAWIGSDNSLAEALEAVQPPRTRPTPPEVFALELAADDLQRDCLAIMGERMPQTAAYSPKQLESTRADLGYILSYLTASIDVGDDEIFTDFTAWLTKVLEMRGVPAVVLEQSFVIIGEVVAAAGMTEAARLCAAYRTRTPR